MEVKFTPTPTCEVFAGANVERRTIQGTEIEFSVVPDVYFTSPVLIFQAKFAALDAPHVGIELFYARTNSPDRAEAYDELSRWAELILLVN